MSDILPPSDPSQNDPFQAAKASAIRAAEELRNATTQKAHDIKAVASDHADKIKTAATERAAEIRDYADQAFADAKVKYADIREEAEKFAREKPMQAVLSAFGVGLFVGLILRR